MNVILDQMGQVQEFHPSSFFTGADIEGRRYRISVILHKL
jgi:hypothetical protein